MNIFTIMLSIALALIPAPKQELTMQQIDEARILVEQRHEAIREEARKRAEEKAKESAPVIRSDNNTAVASKTELITAPEETKAEVIDDTIKSDESGDMELWGTYNVTFYCPCAQHCNSWIGARGNRLTEYYSVAMPNLPMGTRIYISGSNGYDGYYVVEDISPRGICDIFVNDHSQIPSWGTCRAQIYIAR